MAFHPSELFPSSPVFVKFDDYFYRNDYRVDDSDYDSDDYDSDYDSNSDSESDSSFEIQRDRPTISLSEKVTRIFTRKDTFELREDLKAFVNAVSKHFIAYDTIPWVWCEEVGYHLENLRDFLRELGDHPEAAFSRYVEKRSCYCRVKKQPSVNVPIYVDRWMD